MNLSPNLSSRTHWNLLPCPAGFSVTSGVEHAREPQFICDEAQSQHYDDAEADVGDALDKPLRWAHPGDHPIKPSAGRGLIAPLECFPQPARHSSPPTGSVRLQWSQSSKDPIQRRKIRCARGRSHGKLASDRNTQLLQSSDREIVSRLFPLTRQPGSPRASVQTVRQVRTARGDSLVADVSLRIEPADAGGDGIEGGILPESLGREHCGDQE